MRETRADTAQALLLTLLLHALLAALLLAGLWWTRSSAAPAAAGSPLSAELMETSDLSAAMRRTLAKRPEPIQPASPPPAEEDSAPLPQPLPEPSPQDAPVPQQVQAQERVPEPDAIEQEQVDRNALSAEIREREQEQKRRQEQIDLSERQRQEEAEKQQRLAQQQQDDELKQIRAERAKAKREADLAEQKLRQLADLRSAQAAPSPAPASAAPPPGNRGVDQGLAARYSAALQEAILRNWTRPDNVPLGQLCDISIRQLPGGEVIEAQVADSCPYDAQGRRSIEAAVLKAQPLPYAGFELVFNRNLLLHFRAQDR